MIKVYENGDFGSLRTIDDGKATLFCAKDVAMALGYKDTNNAVKLHCKGVVKRHPLKTAGGSQQAVFISEGDVLRLIVSSKLPLAQKYERWVFDEVLPSVHRHGGYIAGQDDMAPEELMARAVLVAQSKIDEMQKNIEIMRLKVLFADAVSASHTSIIVGELAKILRQNGVEIGQNRLFEWLRDCGWLMKSGSSYNMPTQKAMEMGLFEIKETSITHSDGHTTVSKTPKVTGKGQQYFINLFLDVT